jgi:hypothetical protein
LCPVMAVPHGARPIARRGGDEPASDASVVPWRVPPQAIDNGVAVTPGVQSLDAGDVWCAASHRPVRAPISKVT